MDVAQVRRANLLKLFSDFVAQRQSAEPGASLAGVDKAFAELIQIDNSYFSRMKTGSRPVTSVLARQIEFHTRQPKFWLDEEHESDTPKGLTRFLELAEKAYLASPASRKDLTQALKDAISGTKP